MNTTSTIKPRTRSNIAKGINNDDELSITSEEDIQLEAIRNLNLSRENEQLITPKYEANSMKNKTAKVKINTKTTSRLGKTKKCVRPYFLKNRPRTHKIVAKEET